MDQYIRQYGRRLYGLCRSLCRNVQDADDLYQDTWLKALDKLDSYDHGLRRLARSPVRPMEEGEDFPAAEGPDYAPLYEAVRGLPEKLRVTVVLYYFRDMDTAGTAEVLGVPQGTVKSRLSKARKLLKEVLEDASGSSF